MVKSCLMHWVSDRKVDEWFKDRHVFFVLGLGRSGTGFLAHLLDGDENALVLHEPVAEDFDALVDAHKSSEMASRYINAFRKRRMHCLASGKDVSTYGEVNSNLRFHTSALKEAFPNATLLHLVRDGRDVVRSIMARDHYTGDGVGHHSLSPQEDDPLWQEWGELTRFEKICWLWADGNSRVRQDVGSFVKFEKLISDYSYFEEEIEARLGVRVGEERWRAAIKRPRNVSEKYVVPRWTEWESSLVRQFDRICGDEMRKFGYY